MQITNANKQHLDKEKAEMHIKQLFSKKVLIVALAAGITLGAGGAAFAYITSLGSGTGTATLGTQPGVTLNATTSGPLTPGVTVTVTVTADVVPAAGIYMQSYAVGVAQNAAGLALDATTHVAITGCEASWFTIGGGQGAVPGADLLTYNSVADAADVFVNLGPNDTILTAINVPTGAAVALLPLSTEPSGGTTQAIVPITLAESNPAVNQDTCLGHSIQLDLGSD